MEGNPYSTIFFKNLFQLLGFVEFLVFSTGISGCIFEGFSCILKRKQLEIFVGIKHKIILQLAEIMKVSCTQSDLGRQKFTSAPAHQHSRCCGRAQTSSLLPPPPVKGMHWSWCKFLHNSGFIIKTRLFDPSVCQGTPTQLLEPWDWGVRAVCFHPLPSFTQWLPGAQLLVPGALEAHLVPLNNSSLMEEIRSWSSFKSPLMDELIKGRTASVDSNKQLCCYGVGNNCRDMPGLVPRAQLHWKSWSQQKSLTDFYLGTFQVQNFVLNHIPKQSEKKSKAVLAGLGNSPCSPEKKYWQEENISTKTSGLVSN